jgi:hypothetical protein
VVSARPLNDADLGGFGGGVPAPESIMILWEGSTSHFFPVIDLVDSGQSALGTILQSAL